MLKQQRAAPPPGGDPLEFVMSDNSVDRMGDVIDQAGWDLRNFAPDRNPIALFNHDRNQVIGRWRDVRVDGNRLLGRLELAEEGTSPLVNTIRALVRQKILRAVSVGFAALKSEPLNDKADKMFGPFRFLKSELLECSLVSVPANANALATAKQMPRELFAEIFCKPAESEAASRGSSGKPAETHRQMKAAPMTLSQRIQAAQQRANALHDHLVELTNKEELSAEENDAFTNLPDEIEKAKFELQRLMRAEAIVAAGVNGGRPAAPPAPPAPPAPAPASEAVRGEILPPRAPAVFAMPKKKDLDPEAHVLRTLATLVTAHSLREPLEKVLRDRYGGDEITGTVLRTAVNPATTTGVGWAAELVEAQNAAMIDRLLFPSIYLPLAAAGQRLTFNRGVSEIKIPVRGSAAANRLAGSWVGEGLPKPVRAGLLSTVSLLPHKLAVISVFTEEMATYSNPAIEGIIRQAMSDDTSEALDGYLIDNIASGTTRPAGLLNGVTAITQSAGTTAAERMVADLKALVGAIYAAGGGRNIVFLINPAQQLALGLVQTTTGDFVFASPEQAGSKLNARFIVSQTITEGRVIAVDANEFVTATGDTPRFAVSNEATIHMDDAPSALSTPGAPNVVAAPLRSLYQTDSVAIRMSLYVTWVMRRTGMVQTIADVNW